MTETEKIRILHLRASRLHGGPEKQILEHAVRGSSSGLEIWLGSFRDGARRPEFLERAEAHGLPTIELSSGRFDPRTILELVHVLEEQQFSLICTHGYKANLLGWIASRLAGCQNVAFARGWTGENWRIKLYDRLDRLVLRHSDWVVGVSRPLVQELQKTRKGRTAPLFVPNCAILPSENLTLPVNRYPLRKSLGLPDGFVVCAVGRLSPEKGHCHLLQAVPRLLARIPQFQMLLLGEGQERISLQEQTKRLGIENHVTFAGFKTDVGPWIQACDLLVNPSLSEGTPNVVLEAMALGTPVVATSVGGVPDLVEHQKSGILVSPGDPIPLGDAILYLFNHPAASLELARNAQERLREYSPERQTQQLIELYRRVLRDSETQLSADRATLPIKAYEA
jgi:glycosyltransferase involved in cell wall biosynthesis